MDCRNTNGRRSMIVKVQRSLWPPDASALIYDKTRKAYYETSNRKELEYVKAWLGKATRGYFRAQIENDGKLTLLEKVDDQDW